MTYIVFAYGARHSEHSEPDAAADVFTDAACEHCWHCKSMRCDHCCRVEERP